MIKKIWTYLQDWLLLGVLVLAMIIWLVVGGVRVAYELLKLLRRKRKEVLREHELGV